MKRIIQYLYPYRFRMLFGLIIKIFGTLLDLGLPWVLAYMIDEVIPQKKVSVILIWGVIMLLLSLGARTTNIVANRMASKVARDSVQIIRHDLFEKILSLSSAQIDRFTIPSLVSRMTSDTYNIHQMIGMMQRLGVRAPIILIGGVIIMITLDPVLTLILVGTLPFIALVVYLVSKKGIPLYGIQQTSVDHMVRKVREVISGIRIIKALNKTEYEKNKFDEVNKEVVEKELKAGITMASINPFMSLFLNGGLTLVVVIGAYRVNSGYTAIGKIVAFLSYFTIILNAIMMINRIFIILSKATSSAGRIDEVLSEKEDLLKEKIEKRKSEYHIEFEQVSFSYHKNVPYVEEDSITIKGYNRTNNYEKNDNFNNETIEEKDIINSMGHEIPAQGLGMNMLNKEQESSLDNNVNAKDSIEYNIEDLNFRLKQGESLGIIGSTGAGKTTIVNLLMRFYDIDQGSIKIFGKDIKSICKNELRKKFGVVFQNDILFASNIYENISFGREVSIEGVKEAAHLAMAMDFIENLDDTYDSKVATKGANFSGGQKQRMLIARALANRPEILILDDSSSALDYKTDALLRKGIKNHLSNTTFILIAQRISSIMNMDHILVLEEGKMVGFGKHEELLSTCETYNEIFKSQMGGDSFE